MCMSRLHLVVGEPTDGGVRVEDLDGHRHEVSLLAYDGPPPRPGTWLVVHSGYALAPAEPDEAAIIRQEWQARDGPPEVVTGPGPHSPDAEEQP
jgi:hydrogenase maturation factor